MLRQEKEEEGGKVRSLSEQCDGALASLRALQATMSDGQLVHAALQLRASQADATILQYQEDLAQLQGQLEEARARAEWERDLLRQELDLTQTTQSMLETERTTLTQSLDEQQATITTLQEAVQLREAELAGERAVILRIQQELEAAKAELTSTQGTKLQLEAELAEKQVALPRLQDQCTTLHEQVGRLEQSLAEALGAVSQAEADGVNAAVDAMNTVRQIEGRLEEAEQRLLQAAASRDALLAQLEAQAEATGNASSLADQYAAQIDEQTSVVDGLNGDIRSLRAELRAEHERLLEAQYRPEVLAFSTSTTGLAPPPMDEGTQATALSDMAGTSTTELDVARQQEADAVLGEKAAEIRQLRKDLGDAKFDLMSVQFTLKESTDAQSVVGRQLEEMRYLEALKAQEVERLRADLYHITLGPQKGKSLAATSTTGLDVGGSSSVRRLNAGPSRAQLASTFVSTDFSGGPFGGSTDLVDPVDAASRASTQTLHVAAGKIRPVAHSMSTSTSFSSAPPSAAAAATAAATMTTTITTRDAVLADRDEPMLAVLSQQLQDFQLVKQTLLKDVQRKSEKIADLEGALEEVRQQQDHAAKATTTKAQQHRMQILEKNLAQLTIVQKRLVEQNLELKRELGALERGKPKYGLQPPPQPSAQRSGAPDGSTGRGALS